MTPIGLSIVIPTLNEAARLPATFAALSAPAGGGGEGLEILVSDGGSRDATAELAGAAGAQVVTGAQGRGAQLATGADAAQGGWLLFLHADTRLAPGWHAAATAFMADPANRQRAGYGRFRLDDPHPRARRLEKRVAWRCRRFGLPYGDQGLLVARDFYRALGGYRPLPLFEDVDLVRRIGQNRLVPLDIDAVTGAERFLQAGYRHRSARNLALLSLYLMGVPPALLARLY
ncbi:MAG: TIGR04283 family arsenosugar biosynthesis glycosyltransferase [Rhodospirillaceae bacterium]|nr:TIGR04283 family arsenosugar biosynthesis glycosyltransferase [Rhodospirillaceae bacterium]MDE0619622.1 TIGR04283 family arsenosugar biosynthesis glycosyltransferase [Rhodospirillaceae bacterium]